MPKARPYLTIQKSGKRQAFNPEKTRKAQNIQKILFRGMAQQSKTSFPIPKGIPLCVTLRFFHKGRKTIKPKLTVPDVDNLVKLTLDAMTNAGIWHDDNQITKLIAEDYWAGDNHSRIQVIVEEHIFEQQLKLFGF